MTQCHIPEDLNLLHVCAVQVIYHVTVTCAESYIKDAFSSSWFT